MTNAGLLSANADLALPQLGLNAFKFGKYVKGGPAVISAGVKAIKDVRAVWLSNSRTWKNMKVDAIADVRALNIEGMTDELAEKLNKCIYIREVKEFSETTEMGKGNESMKDVSIASEGTMAEVINSDSVSEAIKDIKDLTMAEEDNTRTRKDMDGFDDTVKNAQQA